MYSTALLIEQDVDTVTSQINTSSHSQPATLRESVRAAVREYFVRLDGVPPANLYELFMAEIETPLLEEVLHYSQNNQSRAAQYLKLSRGNLRRKMRQYGFLGPNGKKKSLKG